MAVVAGLFIAGATPLANADEFNVFELPETLVHINDIRTFQVDPGECDTAVTEVQPSFSGSSHCLEVEVFSRGLVEVTACFYNNSVVTGSVTPEDLCYNDYSLTEYLSDQLAQGKTPSNPLFTGSNQALFATFVPDYGPFLDGEDEVLWVNAPPKPFPILAGFQTSGLDVRSSTFSEANTIGGVNVGQNNAYHLNFLMSADRRMAKSDDWRVRIRAIYGPESGPIDAEKRTLEPTKQYKVPYFGSVSTTSNLRRPNVDYGVLSPNKSVTRTGISTARYYMNADSFMALQANTPFTQGDSTIPFTDGAPGVDENALSLQCSLGGQSLFVGLDAREILPTITYPDYPIIFPQRGVDAPTHDCTLTVGQPETLGQYTATMTVSLGEKIPE